MQKLIGLAMSDLAEALRGDMVAQRLGSPRGEAVGPGGSVPPKGRRREPGRALPCVLALGSALWQKASSYPAAPCCSGCFRRTLVVLGVIFRALKDIILSGRLINTFN